MVLITASTVALNSLKAHPIIGIATSLLGVRLMRHSRDYYSTVNGTIEERRDCVLRAVSIAGCVDYALVHKVFERHGRKAGHGTHLYVSQPAIAELFPNARMITDYADYGTALSVWLQSHSTGHYVVFTHDHALAVTDGLVHDWKAHPRCRVRYFWRLDTIDTVTDNNGKAESAKAEIAKVS